MTFDKLTYIDRLKAAGFAEPQARAMADGLDQALREEVATKSDLAVLRAEFKVTSTSQKRPGLAQERPGLAQERHGWTQR